MDKTLGIIAQLITVCVFVFGTIAAIVTWKNRSDALSKTLDEMKRSHEEDFRQVKETLVGLTVSNVKMQTELGSFCELQDERNANTISAIQELKQDMREVKSRRPRISGAGG